MNKINYCPNLLFIVLALAVLVSGCSSKNIIGGDVRVNMRINQDGQISRNFDTFSGFESESLETKMGQTISFDFEATINKGSLIIEWQDPNGAVIWRKILAESEISSEDIVIKVPGRYTIVIQGIDANGSFCVSWNIE